MSRTPGDEPLLRIAEQISDGRVVDWDTEERLQPENTGTLRWLRMLERMSRTYGEVDLQAEAAGGTTRGGATGLQASDPSALEHWGPLRILEHLGGDGAVDRYRAFDPGLQQEVSLTLRHRMPDGGAVPETFLAASRRIVRLRHPGVLAVHGAERFDGWAGIWTDLARGESLEAFLGRRGALTWREAAAVGAELCEALAAIHGVGVTHGDVGAGHLSRREPGPWVLGGFAPVESPSASARGASGAAGPSADLLAAGLVLVRIVTGVDPERDAREPWDGGRAREAWSRTRTHPDVGRAFVSAVDGALDPGPGRRHADAARMARLLRDASAAE